MSENFKDWNLIEVFGSNVDFYEKIENGIRFIGFDSTALTPPGPMVNAMAGLNLIKDKFTKLIMINHKFPVGLIPKISYEFDYEKEDLKSGFVKIIFSLKEGVTPKTYDINQVCHG
ncbi:Uncharacterised protein [Campylobacter sputorum subsp. bubulus]|uniref:Uncharacterized protein n=1 Tax=Campylobacter sputorum subsp. sputorum TaxID=32024 RepID=A0A381DI99_9BACT|nr:hypothetical protein [Campylobacter sputorum]ASM35408.1 hypothetical protein CSPUT_1209 [Campylobacter sputorum aubsp. sputorum RM3237]KAB0582848.1 hypothetical protein F7P64_01575 [Campylobacter sputorum subsp. sputorum]QEL05600.1 hypothetical protein CSPT_1207 [Campylobacter sputorum subsp. sputorum]SUX08557.1 Uncharacterised protein [Campylobacter sputorum subsp. bubulus]SUX10365.1 Uncharacterised protein [Campylobacter sputorum subsp. sputorum]